MKKSTKYPFRQLSLIFSSLLILALLSSMGCISDQKTSKSPRSPAAMDNSTASATPDSKAKPEEKKETIRATKDWQSIAAEVESSVVLIAVRQYVPILYENRPCPWPWSLGSGVIIDKRGYILTNYHVVEQAQTIYVFLNDGNETKVELGKEHIASLIKKNKKADLAIIKISPDNLNLPEAAIGDSSILKRGDNALAIGYPRGFYTLESIVSFTTQIDSGLESSECVYFIDRLLKDIPGLYSYFSSGTSTATQGMISATRMSDNVSVIQTDVAINPGNSGGPLLNNRGEVIGVNTWVAPPDAYGRKTEGMAFTIAINEAKSLIREAVALLSPPLIYHVRCSVLSAGGYSEEREGSFARTTISYPPGTTIIEWKTNEPATSQVAYIWNPTQSEVAYVWYPLRNQKRYIDAVSSGWPIPADVDIFEIRSNEPSECQKFCTRLTTQTRACELLCRDPALRTTQLDNNLTLNHKVILTDFDSEGEYDFKIMSLNESGNEAISGEYRYLWTTKLGGQ